MCAVDLVGTKPINFATGNGSIQASDVGEIAASAGPIT